MLDSRLSVLDTQFWLLAPGSWHRMASHRIVLFSASECRFCGLARAMLEAWGEPFTERTVDEDPNAMRELLFHALEARVPAILVDDQMLVGFDAERLEEMLREPVVDPEIEDDSWVDQLLRDSERLPEDWPDE
ncbi:MAG TPA: glutaredoxin family protein [Vicinamibacterales bacterium]